MALTFGFLRATYIRLNGTVIYGLKFNNTSIGSLHSDGAEHVHVAMQVTCRLSGSHLLPASDAERELAGSLNIVSYFLRRKANAG